MKHEFCYVYLEVDSTIGVVKFGESGYYKTNYEADKSNEELVNKLNEQLGVSKTEAEAMKILSMNEGITAERFAERFDGLVKSLEERGV